VHRPWFQRSKLEYDEALLVSDAVNVNLRRYRLGAGARVPVGPADVRLCQEDMQVRVGREGLSGRGFHSSTSQLILSRLRH